MEQDLEQREKQKQKRKGLQKMREIEARKRIASSIPNKRIAVRDKGTDAGLSCQTSSQKRCAPREWWRCKPTIY